MRQLGMLWALIAIPFWVTGLTGGPDGLLPHAIFHPVYIAFAAGAIVALLNLRSMTTRSVWVGRLALALVVAQGAAIVGQIGEEIAVLLHGGLSAGEQIFEEPLHVWSASLTIPGLLISQILLVALSVVAIRSRAQVAAAA